MSDKIITLKDKDSNNLYPTSSYNAIKDPNGYVLPDDFTKFSLLTASGTNYRKYDDGLLIYWGYFDNGSYSGDKYGITVNFTVPFISTPSFISTSGRIDNSTGYRSTNCNFYNLTTTSVSYGWYGNTARAACWVAIGKWK